MTSPAPPDIQDLPTLLRQIAEVCGLGVALTLAAEYGSSHGLYVPRTPRIDHPLAQLVGWEAMQALCHHWGGERLQVPRAANAGNAKRVILAAPEDARSADVARRAGCTVRYVRRVRALSRPDGRQGKLL